ncbi:DUF6448 family protein [Raineyella fluvialis]|uniref:DUF6448 family protein n=1 Tax=Raineyella fluvialis TaxID=2662261 RepID=UPI00188F9C1F|nr:DUF6448 family protein [Raineyella fluvialis]
MSLRTLLRSLVETVVPTVRAHCDTADGPAVTDGRRALETGNVNFALKWIQADAEAELVEVFTRSLAVRRLGTDARWVADRLFLETLVRLHRMGEGVGFTGIQPTGTELPAVVVAADRALDIGDDTEVRGLVPAARSDELHRRFGIALAKKDFDIDDVDAARDFVAAYVSYFKYAEGEEHEHHGHEHHGHEHAEHQHAEHEHAH